MRLPRDSDWPLAMNAILTPLPPQEGVRRSGHSFDGIREKAQHHALAVGRTEPPSVYVFSAMSQSSSSSSFVSSAFRVTHANLVLVRFSGDPRESSAACFLHSSLFHPGKPKRPTEDETEDD